MEKKMSNKTRDQFNLLVETETNKVDGSAKERKRKKISLKQKIL